MFCGFGFILYIRVVQLNNTHAMKQYRVNYGFMSAYEHSINIVCEEKDAHTIAYAIYKGEIGDNLGVLTISDGEKETVLMDRM